MSLLCLLFSLLTIFLSLKLISSSPSSQPTAQTLEIKPEIINPKLPPSPKSLSTSKKFEGSSNLVNLKYHMGPVLSSSPINVYLIWYGRWASHQQLLIKDFLHSISPTSTTSSSASAATKTVAEWWKTVSLYTDQTGANVSRNLLVAGEYSDHRYSQGTHLTRLSVQQVIANAVRSAPFPIDHKNGVYLILTSVDVTMQVSTIQHRYYHLGFTQNLRFDVMNSSQQDFCRAVCGFHYFTFPSLVGYTIPYAWIGNSGKQCPEVCAYPFAVPGYMAGGGPGELRPPNGDVGVDGMISVIGHELAELSSNPLINAWYAGEDPTAPTEIGDLCEGLYGTGGGGGYIGQVMRDRQGKTFNMYGKNGRKFLVQWVWSPVLKACSGPNALD